MTDETQMLRVSDIATRWRCSRELVRRRIREGAFANAIDVGKHRHNWRVPLADVIAYEQRDRPP